MNTDELDAQIGSTQAECDSARSAYNSALVRVRTSGDRSQALAAVSSMRSTVESLEAELQALKEARQQAVVREASEAAIERRRRAVDAGRQLKTLLVSRLQQEAVVLDAMAIAFVRAVHSYAAKSRDIGLQARRFIEAAWPRPEDQLPQVGSFVDMGAEHGFAVAMQTMLRAAMYPLPDHGGSIVTLNVAYGLPPGYVTFSDGAAKLGAASIGIVVDDTVRTLELDRDATVGST